jgi:ribosome recycling factor
MENLKAKTSEKMDGTISALKNDLASISTGRATPKLLDTIKVEVYGSFMPLAQIATVSAPDATTICVQVWDKGNVSPVEKAISNANLGFNPMTDGQLIRINIPSLTEERRKEFTKLAKKYGEDKKISIRNARHDTLDQIKKMESDFSKDEIHNFQNEIQKITDDFVKKIDEMVAQKEKDIMTI